MDKKSDLTQGSIRTHIRRIAIPASIGMLFNTLFNVVDTIYAGNIGTNALAGMSLSFPIFFIIIALAHGIGIGTTALVSNALGEKDLKAFHNYGLNALALGILAAIVLPVIGKVISKPLFEMLGAQLSTLNYGMDYINLIFMGSIFFILSFLFNSMLSSQGDTVSYRNILIAGFFMNLILDPLFILGWFGLPKMGTAGVALATVIVQAISSIYLAYKVVKSNNFNIHEFRGSKLSPTLWFDILKQGIPASLNMMTIALGVFVINYFVIMYGGDTSVAAYGAAVRIEQLALLPALGLNIATLTITGQNYGAKKYARISSVYKKSLLYGVVIMTSAMILIYPTADFLITIFNKDPAVIKAGTDYLRIEYLCFNTYILMNVSISLLQGLKRPGIAIYVGIYRQLLMPVIVFYALGSVMNMGLLGVWWGIVLINWTAAVFTVLYTLKKLKDVEIELTEQNTTMDISEIESTD